MTFRLRNAERTIKQREQQALANSIILTLHVSLPVDSHNPFHSSVGHPHECYLKEKKTF